MEHSHGGPMTGQTVLVTGATSGIGRATALGLAALGARVAITGRDRGRTETAAGEISAAGGGSVDVFIADLSSQAQVRRLVSEVLQGLSRIDVLINNVGGYWNTRHLTADRLERTFALNHLAPFLLTNLLLNRLKRSAPARVINVASNAHTGDASISWTSRVNSPTPAAGPTTSPSSRTFCSPTNRKETAWHCGHRERAPSWVVRTSFGAEDPAWMQRFLVPLLRPVMKSPTQGAGTSIHLASARELGQVSGCYFANLRPTRSSRGSYDRAVAMRLWEASADLVGLTAASRV